jgi:hypothetical protein
MASKIPISFCSPSLRGIWFAALHVAARDYTTVAGAEFTGRLS